MYIGNMIGKTVKVDKNTLTKERGKYARLCIQVNLLKPFLSMFLIKGRHYKIEYERLHLLCLSCGQFGHSTSGCFDTKAPKTEAKVNPVNEGKCQGATTLEVWIKAFDPWMVVHKPRSTRKERVEFAKKVTKVDIAGPSGKSKCITSGIGSRSQAFSDVMTEIEENKELELHPTSSVKDDVGNAREDTIVDRIDVTQAYKGKRTMRRASSKEYKKNKNFVNGGDTMNSKGEWMSYY